MRTSPPGKRVVRSTLVLQFQNFSSCACVNGPAAAENGRCDAGCDHMEAFLVILFVVVFITCLGQNPALLITLR